MAKFIALPVGQGDSFYLDRGNGTILVDGGKSKSALPDMFRRVTGKGSVDILVCTHNDADHVNGVLGFLESELRCGELWLPGRWLAVLPDVLVPLHTFVENVSREMRLDATIRSFDDLDKPISIEEYAAKYEELDREIEPVADGDMERDHNGLELGDDGWPSSVINHLESAQPWGTAGGLVWPFDLWPWIDFFYDCPTAGRNLMTSFIDAASRIREAAILAFHKGVTVRWFEHYPSVPSGGTLEVLLPANARQLLRMWNRKASVVEYISLSVANRESLVFWAPPTKRMPGVLFTADSDLAKMSLPAGVENSLATAPHHGSESNADAYDAVMNASGDGKSVTWIRSDGRFLKRPGDAYLMKTTKRFCTLCRIGTPPSSKPKQAVRMFTSKGKWVRHKECHPCACTPLTTST
ncbi:MBL fold metallo-hydrolase [Pseudomonas sp. zjy_9]